ncbi:MAG: chromosome segregation protein SMC [Candidatus Woesearchaeota archaeon]|nr:chromosome segregation protein SMC [Candidatus Woesearchaeota archaeon]
MPMTKINKLVMEGFKSFARRTEIVFGGDFNCVLGPNGAGKSNILDALCFVLGKSSAKALRSEKAANLIYNGGKTKKPAKEAEVSIYLDNASKIFPTDSKEVKITRIVRQNGQSIYKINNETRTRQEIMELLALAKVDPDAYNIILQGDIIRFVEMQPEERRQLIEEIAGISVYEEKKQKAIAELQRVEERLKEADIILNERKARLNELEKEREQALKFKEINDRIKRMKASLIYKRKEAKEKEKEDFDSKIDSYKKTLEEKQSEINEIKKRIKESKERIDEINKEIEAKGEKEQVELNKEIEKLKIDIASSKNRVDTIKAEILKIKQRKEQLKQNNDELKLKIEKTSGEKESLKKQILSYEKELSMIEKRIGEFKKKNKLDDIESLEKEIDSLDKEAEEKQKEIQKLREQQQELLREKDRIELQINAVEEKIAKVLEIEKENRAQLEDLKGKREIFKKITLELNKLISKDSELAAQLQNARNMLLKMQEDLSLLKAKRMSIEEKLGKDSALKSILDLRNKISGIYGTVSELGRVDSKYSLALEIAAGTKITSVVVKDDEVASKCIKYLKEKKLGVVSFIPLNKIKPVERKPELDAIKSEEGVYGYAIDLIEFDPKFKNAFSYVFGNTLVVDTIDTARRIGIGKVKMVTLDGDLAEFSGAMQGGYRKKESSGLGFIEREIESEIEKCEKSLDDQKQLVERLERDKKNNENSIERLRKDKADLEGDIIKLEKLLNLQAGDTDASKKEKKELESARKEIDKKIDSLAIQVSECNKVLAENKIKRQQIRGRITELRSPALLAELNAFEEKRKQIKEEIIAKTGEIKNIDAQISNIFRPELENISKIIKQLEKEEEGFKNDLKLIAEKNSEMESLLKEKEAQQKKFQTKFKELFIEKGKIDQKIKKDEEKIETLVEQLRNIEQKINNINIDSAKVRTELSSLEEEFKQYQGIEIIRNKTESDLRKELGICEGILTKIGAVNMKSLEIYDQVSREYENLMKKKEKLNLEKEDVLIMINEIELKKKDMFMKTFDAINENFKNIFSALSTKGEAYLALENEEIPFSGGLLIKVRITGNKFLDIRGLSGGEKTLTALAFIFAIQEHEPAPFYIFDEVDAALDKKNSEKLGQLIKKYSEKAQYIIITHNDGIITEAKTLYGISMDEHGRSNVVSLRV